VELDFIPRDTIGELQVIISTPILTGTTPTGTMAIIAGGRPKPQNNQIDLTEIPYMKIIYKSSIVTPALMGAVFVTTGPLGAARPTTVYGPSSITLSNAEAAVAGVWQMSWINKQGENEQGTLQIEQNGSTLGGTFRGSFRITGALQGEHVSFTVKAFGRQLSFSGTVKGNSMRGVTEQQTPWSAARS
jgi:hypothetical protein